MLKTLAGIVDGALEGMIPRIWLRHPDFWPSRFTSIMESNQQVL